MKQMLERLPAGKTSPAPECLNYFEEVGESRVPENPVFYLQNEEVEPILLDGWWARYPQPCQVAFQSQPAPHQKPAFAVGDMVRLRAKPHKARQVIAVQWHPFRYEYSYVIETSAPPDLAPYCPYWFASQLILDSHYYEPPQA